MPPIVLAKVEPEFEYFGLDQQYFHKSVMLVTYHKENEYTKAIILNRPTNLFLGDEDFVGDDGEPIVKDNKNRTESSWRIWYGGDVRGLMDEDHDAEVVCLHSIDTNLARNVSEVLMNNLMMTNCEGAIQIIDAKQAEARDFWMFAGYAGWTGGQFLGERESWYMISADSGTVWKELVRQRDEENADPRDAGLKTWSSLMQAFGKENEAKVLSESFADLTLKEWAADTILFNSTDESDNMQEGISSLDAGEAQISDIFGSFFSTSRDTLDEMVELAGYDDNGLAGSLLRGSPAENDKSPFLLSDQKFHKSSLLILQDDGRLTIGVMINHATTNSYSVALPNGRTVEIPIRYGGSSGYPDVIDQPTIFLHAKPNLKEISLGEPVGGSGYNPSKIWICSEEEAVTAITEGFASHRDFMIIEGFSIWNEKDIIEAILEGKFELVDSSFTEEIWGSLLEQASLSLDTLDRNCRLASDAWGVAGKIENPFPRCVYDSSITISELADDALRYWIEAFLLGGVVSAGGKYSSFE
mmetsp:Transcript_2713/g.4853  ORF Transcript_2713/g.4853 Transcript_2713/m.4853 type:complete len:527 (-) Transcript_2713:64-1644(-)